MKKETTHMKELDGEEEKDKKAKRGCELSRAGSGGREGDEE